MGDPRFEERPWGSFEVLDDAASDHKVKRLVVAPHKRLSYQSHERRSEHVIVVSGVATVTIDDRDFVLGVGESVDVPVRAKHRYANLGEETLVLIEVQLGDYFGEDDIVRYEDDFGRLD